jgi:hypothetical protein
MVALAVRISIQLYSVRGGPEPFGGFSQDGERADCSESLLASLLNKCLSNEPNFNPIHLTGQYLQSGHSPPPPINKEI